MPEPAFDLVMAEACRRLGSLFADPRVAADPLASAAAVQVLLAEDMADLNEAVDRLGERIAEIAARERPRPAAAMASAGGRARLRL
jgi:hypothetical protein